jgi:hypothetical protein
VTARAVLRSASIDGFPPARRGDAGLAGSRARAGRTLFALHRVNARTPGLTAGPRGAKSPSNDHGPARCSVPSNRLPAALVEALEMIARTGSVAPATDTRPMTMIINQLVEFQGLAAWDDERMRLVLTAAGRDRLARHRAGGRSATVLPFRRREPRDGAAARPTRRST